MTRALSRAARLREIENLLFRYPKGLRITEIAAACGVNRRTIYRDIDLLSESGVPIWQDEGHYGVVRDQYLATIRLRFHEAVALYIAARLLARHADEHNPSIVSALNKIATAFPEPLADYMARTAQAIETRPVNETNVAVLQEIALAWAEGHKLRIRYRSAASGKARERNIAPYTLEPSATGGLYVIAHDDLSEEVRTFKLDRIERVTRLADTYTIPETFDPRSHLADAWGIMTGDQPPTRVHLHFSAAVAPFIRERIWHPSQRLETLKDGSINLWVEIGDQREMRPWIRSWGAEVEVIEPASLRADLAADARRLHKIYQSG